MTNNEHEADHEQADRARSRSPGPCQSGAHAAMFPDVPGDLSDRRRRLKACPSSPATSRITSGSPASAGPRGLRVLRGRRRRRAHPARQRRGVPRWQLRAARAGGRKRGDHRDHRPGDADIDAAAGRAGGLPAHGAPGRRARHGARRGGRFYTMDGPLDARHLDAGRGRGGGARRAALVPALLFRDRGVTRALIDQAEEAGLPRDRADGRRPASAAASATCAPAS